MNEGQSDRKPTKYVDHTPKMAYNFGVWSEDKFMLPRLLKLPKNRSLFLFGARNTGKSTLLQQVFTHEKSIWINLLEPSTEELMAINPDELRAIVLGASPKITHVIVDEIQKVPQLLNIVHHLIETTSIHFVMSGSSARKLKQKGVNLLAGRAFVYHLFPFSFIELGKQFNLNHSLRWGLLPKIHQLDTDEERMKFLQAYTHTYLREEIWAEQFIRKLDPFRRFLEVSAQSNGKIINYANIARDVGVDDKTIKEYFSILEDTLIGFMLEPFEHSFRKRLSLKPKFYYFDLGVVRSLTRTLSLPLIPSTSSYGEVFEHFIILECIKLAAYFAPEYRFSYLKTKDDAEVDLVIERPGLPILFVEIKSNKQVQEKDLRTLITLSKDFKKAETMCLSNDAYTKKYGAITVMPWQKGLKYIFNL